MKGHYTAQQRRALNQVWSAAGRYGFEPLFLAIRGGKCDLYMNCIVGCAHRLYGDEALSALFASWEGDRQQGMLDDLAWLGVEEAVFRREVPERPALESLRRTHAAEFFAQEHTLSRQEWMAKNQLVYTMQAARWREVLERRGPVMTPRERRLYAALTPAGAPDGAALREALLLAFSQAGVFHGRIRGAGALHFHFSDRWAPLLTKLAPSEIVHTDMLSVSRSTGGAGLGGGGRLDTQRARLRLNENAETDREYIESCFGRSLFSPEQLSAAEQELCTGKHQGCKLWFTAGTPDSETAKSGESRLLAEEAAKQEKRSRDAFTRDADLYQNAILRLTEQIRGCIQVHSQRETELARAGRLSAPRVWRGAVVRDGSVFLRERESPRSSFSVDLLLDASASRLHCQETIAAEGYVLSESLRRCGVPVRITSFCSVRGYTVLRVLKGFEDKGGERNVFRYFAAGWNRDGLALRMAGELMKSAPLERRLLLLLTDASPNDSHRIPAGADGSFSREYAGEVGVVDAADEVRALRREGVRVAAVFMGGEEGACNAQVIYGKSVARIRSVDQLARAAGRLIQDEIQELSD